MTPDRWSAVLAAARSPADFGTCLRQLYEESGLRSAEAVARASRDAGHPVSGTTVRALLAGGSRPTSRSVIGFLHGCGLPPDAHRPWTDAYHRVHGDRPAPVTRRYLRSAVDQAVAPFAGGGFLGLLAQLLDLSGWLVVAAVLVGGAGATIARWRWNTSRLQACGGIALTVLGLGGILTLPARAPGPAIPVLTGDYNVAVATFTHTVRGDVPAEVRTEAGAFEAGVVRGVQQAVDDAVPVDADLALLRIEVREVPATVPGKLPADRLAAARSLARRSNADALLFGDITNDGAALIVTPRLWLSARALPRAEELSGVHTLPVAREEVTRPDAAIRIRRLVAGVAGDLAALTELVRLYDSGRYEPALALARRVRAQGFVQPALLSVLEGNLAGKLRRFADARTAYRAALPDPDYRRASAAEIGRTQEAAHG